MYDENIKNRGNRAGRGSLCTLAGLGRSRCVSLRSPLAEARTAQTPKAAKHRRRPPNSHITYTFYSYYL